MPESAGHSPQSSLSLHLFGAVTLSVRDMPRPITGARSADRLLALLALRGEQATPREWLAEALWPDAGRELALNYLRRSLSALRQILGPEAYRILTPDRTSIRLDLAGADCDLLAFDAAIARGDAVSLEQAISLYRGPL